MPIVQKQKILRGGKNTQNCIKKVLMSQINMMVSWLDPDILECEVRWALRSMSKASGGVKFQLSNFKS